MRLSATPDRAGLPALPGPGDRTPHGGLLPPSYTAPAMRVRLLASTLLLAAVTRPSPEELLDRMENAGRSLTGYSTVLVKQEWIGGGLAPEERFEVEWAPGRVHLVKLDEPAMGREIEWAKDARDGNMRVVPHSFPWIPLTLDPYGPLALRETRHPVPESDIPALVRLLSANLRRALEQGEGTIGVEGPETLLGRPCWKLVASAPARTSWETIGPGESLWEVARRAGHPVSPILQANIERGWRSGNDGKPGDRVRVPAYYATRVELWLDADSWLPLGVLLYDLEGRLFERFEHRELRGEFPPSPTDARGGVDRKRS